MDVFEWSSDACSITNSEESPPPQSQKRTFILSRRIAFSLYFAAALLLIFKLVGVLPRSQTTEYASRITIDRTRYVDSIITAVEALTYQFYVNQDLNALLYDFSLSYETYEVSKWNMPFSIFLDGMVTTIPELEEAIFFDIHNEQKRPLTMTDSITRTVWNTARNSVSKAAKQADGRPVWQIVTLPGTGTKTELLRAPFLVCARLIKFVPSGSQIGVLVLLLNPERLARAVAGSYWEDSASIPKSDFTVLVDDHGIVLGGIGAGMIGRDARELVPGFPDRGFDPKKEHGLYYYAQAILGRPSQKYLVLYQRLLEHSWWLCTVLPHTWEGNSIFDYLSPALLAFAGLVVQWAVRKRAITIETVPARLNRNTSQTTLTEAETQILQSLTSREKTILSLLVLGKSNKEIASELGLQEQTVKNYLYALYRKLDVQDRVGATRFAFRSGIAPFLPSHKKK